MFRFKQFTIQQDRTAMKVCTDACVLGAYANVTDVDAKARTARILDIGTGTGLLALMAAQRNPLAIIDAVEVDDSAFAQATENVTASPFAARINVVHTRIQDFVSAATYDRILTNPPFYTNHLRSPDAAVNRALHTDELSFDELIAAVVRLMKPTGQWWVLLPPYETEKLTKLAGENGLFPFQRLLLRHHTQKPAFRFVTGFSFDKESITEQSLAVYEHNGQTFTGEFRALLRDFYLIF
ncbi:tRNA1(Val) (adenine(37)-N6)-methyltransferase [Spirosoma validum]|uniref:tRNA1(Val) (adenine(37)-N6)-methyltransferase n=1 Tax=Spirosoma validum TaxID=2771355 RepID=A0A927B7V1_9BACT|nr:methyltransferase [Spirosoma validum]MBD2757339.1 methyltransferase [Spirosoma validum]